MEFDFNTTLHGPITLDSETHDPKLKTRGSGWAYSKTDMNAGKIIGIAVRSDNCKVYLPIGHTEGNLDPVKVKGWLNEQLQRDEKQRKIFANAMYDVGWFKAEGINIKGPIDDVMFMAPLLDENRMNYSLDRLGLDYLNIGKDETGLAEVAKKMGIKNTKADNIKAHLMRVHPDIVGVYAEQDVEVTYQLWKFFQPLIEEQELTEVYQLECDLIPMLIDMRMRGVRVDVKKAELEQRRLLTEEQEAKALVKDITGIELGSWDNAAEIARILDKAQIKYGYTEKNNQPSITAGWLKSLNNPLTDAILRGRKLANIRSTFLENSILMLQEGGRVFPNFNQLRKDDDAANGVIGKEMKSGTKGTVSGRFSSSSPNFQQIPSPERDPDLGYLVRSLFLPEEGEKWHSLDYSSQEPRMIVHFAELTRCRKASMMADRYRDDPNTDFHNEVREMVATKNEAWEDPKMRKPAKVIGLGLAYGMGGGKLAFTLGMDYIMATFQKGDKAFEYMKAGPEAQELLELFNDQVPFIKELANKCQRAVRDKGYIRTAVGRRFRFPTDEDGKYMFLNKALNRLIQGSSADMTKKSLRDMYRAGILPHGTVHDENCLSSADPRVVKEAKEIMENCYPLRIPIVVDVGTGDNWGEASEKAGTKNYENFMRTPEYV